MDAVLLDVFNDGAFLCRPLFAIESPFLLRRAFARRSEDTSLEEVEGVDTVVANHVLHAPECLLFLQPFTAVGDAEDFDVVFLRSHHNSLNGSIRPWTGTAAVENPDSHGRGCYTVIVRGLQDQLTVAFLEVHT